jgi:tRNA(Ile)-lysidine synthase
MARSHPPTLLTVTARTLRAERLVAKGDRLLVAVSGGPDSMALLHVLALLRSKMGHALVAHGVDHGLRTEAAAELDLAAELSRTLAVPFDRTGLRVPPGGNLQARARDARYAALRAAAARAGCSAIATAHHRADRAETVLLRLLRGAGPRGLAVLPPRSGDLVRPLLRATREAIDAHLARHGVPFARDPSNRDPRFLRVRVRMELLPLLRALSPSIEEHLCALADQLLLSSPAGPPETHGLGDADPRALGRAAREALAQLAATRSPGARVALGDGRVARWNALAGAIAVETQVQPRRRARSGDR